MRKRTKIIVGIALCSSIFALEFIWPRVCFKSEEIEFCKAFLSDDPAIRGHFGSITSVELAGNKGTRGTVWNSSKGRISYGVYHFRVESAERKGTVRVRWEDRNGRMIVDRVRMRTGIAGTHQLWPTYKATPGSYILPSHVWDGFISLGATGFLVLTYYGLRKHRRWALFIFFIARLSEGVNSTIRYLCVVASVCAFIESILCFLNFTTLF
jgi:hypothetical protein